jgi:hypothetical protein
LLVLAELISSILKMEALCPPKRRFWSKGSCHEIQEFKKCLNNTTAPNIITNPSITAVKANCQEAAL